MKTVFKFSKATMLFAIVMFWSIELYLYVTGQKLYDTVWPARIAIIKDIALFVAFCGFFLIIWRMMSDYVNNSFKDTILAEAEISFVQVKRNIESGDETETRYDMRFAHTIPDDQIENVIKDWHRFRDKTNGDITVEKLCEYVNIRTPYLACTSKQELVDRLKNK